MAVEEKDLLRIVYEALFERGILTRGAEIKYSVKVGNEWRLNIYYTRLGTGGTVLFPTDALLAINAETGEVIQFKEGRTWK